MFNQFLRQVSEEGGVSMLLLNDVNNFEKNVKSHLSFDTYFKKLFHQKDYSTIKRCKSILLLYFLFEHLITPEMIEDVFKMNYEVCNGFKKEQKLDLRYEALIAGLLKPSKRDLEFYTNINFITWNYDANLLLSLKNFIDPYSPFKEFILRNYSDGVFKFNNVNVYHLNGFINHNLINYVNQPNALGQFIGYLKNEYNFEALESGAESIRFSWEQEFSMERDIDKAILNSGHVVLIGYSLPLYNRLFDLKIFKKENMSRKDLIIQDLRANEVSSILKSDFQLDFESFEGVKLKVYDNCRSFLVPNSIFHSI